MIFTAKDLKSKYKELSRKEKERVGVALVKVNLGVSAPADLKIVAEFVKGSAFMAREGALDELIHVLHVDDTAVAEEPNKSQRGEPQTKVEPIPNPSLTEIEKLDEYDEDSVATEEWGKVK